MIANISTINNLKWEQLVEELFIIRTTLKKSHSSIILRKLYV